jgi:hypothetical protein
MVSAVIGGTPLSVHYANVVLARARTDYHKCIGRMDKSQSSQNACLRLWVPGRASLARDDVGKYCAPYFIGQTASATAACGGKIVTNLPPIYCSSTGSASLFWPISSNFTRFHGMMV